MSSNSSSRPRANTTGSKARAKCLGFFGFLFVGFLFLFVFLGFMGPLLFFLLLILDTEKAGRWSSQKPLESNPGQVTRVAKVIEVVTGLPKQ